MRESSINLLVVDEEWLAHIKLAPVNHQACILVSQDGVDSLGIERTPPEETQQGLLDIRKFHILFGDIGATTSRIVAGRADGMGVHFGW